MRLAYITTTIRPPTPSLLRLASVTDAPIIVAGDRNTPHDHWRSERWTYLHPDDQQGWGCSHVLGWNTVQRRNIALLEALRMGAERIVTIDDDNTPGRDHPQGFMDMLNRVPSSVRHAPWFDPGSLLEPAVTHRGMPIEHRGASLLLRQPNVERRRIGVVAGLWLGDPDVDAVERIALDPKTRRLRRPVVTTAETWAPYNSQNTGFLRRLAPCMFVLPFVGRYDDIYASYLARRVMREFGYLVYYGLPLVHQDRNPHDLLADLAAEIDGMRKTIAFVNALSAATVSRASVLDATLDAYLAVAPLLPERTLQFVRAWVDDVKEAL